MPIDLDALMERHSRPGYGLVRQIRVDASESWVSETGSCFSLCLLIGDRPWARVEQRGVEIAHDWAVTSGGMSSDELVEQRSHVEAWLQHDIDEVVTADALVGALANCLVTLDEPTAPQALLRLRTAVFDALEYADDEPGPAFTSAQREAHAALERHRWRCIDCRHGTDPDIEPCATAASDSP